MGKVTGPDYIDPFDACPLIKRFEVEVLTGGTGVVGVQMQISNVKHGRSGLNKQGRYSEAKNKE